MICGCIAMLELSDGKVIYSAWQAYNITQTIVFARPDGLFWFIFHMNSYVCFAEIPPVSCVLSVPCDFNVTFVIQRRFRPC